MNKIVLIFIATISIWGFSFDKISFSDPKNEIRLQEIVFTTLLKKHLVTHQIDNDFSKKIFNNYLENLDRYKVIFLQSDVAEFKKYELQIDDQIKNNELTFFYLTRERYLLRLNESKTIYTNLLKNKLDFSKDEVEILKTFPKFSKNNTEKTDRWKILLKDITFTEIKKLIFLKNLEEIIDKIFEYEKNDLFRRVEVTTLNIDNISNMSVFSEYLNAIVETFDRHSKFYLPHARDEYLIRQSGKNIGIGIMTTLKDNFIAIQSMTVGGPSWKTKKIEIGDVILKIAQDNEEPVNVVGFSLYQGAKLTRGKAGSIVKLTIKKPDGTIVVVPIKRGVVSSDDSYLKSCLTTKNNVKYGLITFPKFYNDFDDDKARNVVDDFEEELQVLRNSDAQGLIIDIRENGGGSVEAAVKIIGNFISSNPVVQLKDKDQKIRVLNCENKKINWSKGVVLIVNAQTASAAEIITSSFKEYNIGVILGETTFGKGTVQEFLDLNTFNSKKTYESDLGSLRISTQKYYKLDGNAVQKNGIVPDVDFSTKNTYERENTFKESLEPDKEKSIEFKKSHDIDFFKNIILNSQKRLENNSLYKDLKSNKSENDLKKITTIKAEKFAIEFKSYLDQKNASMIEKYKNNLTFYGTTADAKMLKNKEYLIVKRKEWLENLPKDFIIEEAINILEDLYLQKK